jgi:hypothetical protein
MMQNTVATTRNDDDILFSGWMPRNNGWKSIGGRK